MSKPAPAFTYQKPFPLGRDTTVYKNLTGEFVSVGEFEGKPVLKVEPEALTYLARTAVRDVSFLLRPAHLAQVAAIREDKKLGSPWGFAASVGGSVDRTALAGSIGGRYRITEEWIVGLDAGWNPWITTSPIQMKAGVATGSATLIRRFPMKFDRVNLRTSRHLGTSTLLFDVYGAPKYSTGPYIAFSPLGIDYDLGNSVRIVLDPMEMALPVPLIGQLPLYYEQFRFMIGIQIGG